MKCKHDNVKIISKRVLQCSDCLETFGVSELIDAKMELDKLKEQK